MTIELERHQLLCRVLVGRDEEQALMSRAVDAASEGHGGVVFILGEPGIGKTRLAREAARFARNQGFELLIGRAARAEAPVAFRPLCEAVLSIFRDSGPPETPELAPFRAALGRLVPEWRQDDMPIPGDSIVMLGEGLLRLLRVLALPRRRGCLLVLDDLQWADYETLSIVEYLADNLMSERVLCVAIARAEEGNPAVEVARDLEARRAASLVELTRLTEPAVRRMAGACLPGATVADEVIQALLTWTEGVPFFIEELLAGWISSGALLCESTGWCVGNDIGPVVPPTFSDTVRRRLAALGPEGARVIYAAAGLGRQFDWSLLPAMTGSDEASVLETLRRGIDAQLIAPDALQNQPAFRFRHVLTRDAVLKQLLDPERRALARRALEAMEAAHPGLPGQWCDLAADLCMACGDLRRGARLFLQAGERDLERGALATAEAKLTRALEACCGEVELRGGISAVLTQVLAQAGKIDEASSAGRRALELLDRGSASASMRVKLHLCLAGASITASRRSMARTHLDEARRLSEEGQAESLLASVDALDAEFEIGRGHPETASALAQAALGRAEALGLGEVACEALEVIGRCARLHDLPAARAAFERARRLAEEGGLSVCRLRAIHELSTVDMLSGGPIDRLLEARDLAHHAGALATAATVDLQIAAWYVIRFDPEHVLDSARRCAASASRYRLDVLAAIAACFEAVAHAMCGRRADMEQAIEAAVGLAGDDLDVRGASWGEARALLSLIEEDRPRALAELEKAMGFLRQSKTTIPGPSRGLLALLRAVEDSDAEVICEEVRSSGVTVHRLNQAYLGYAEAVLVGRAGWRDQAEAAFARADADLHELPWYRHLVRRLVGESALDDQWGDPAGWLREAMVYFEAQGHQQIACACRSLLRRAGVPVPRKRRGGTEVPEALRTRGITSREAGVLALLGEGLSNRDIAVRLYLSPRTAERHVASVMAKLGVETRAQAVAVAARLATTPPSSQGRCP